MDLHRLAHGGREQLSWFAHAAELSPEYGDIAKVVSSCQECSSIDPMPVTWERGELSVEENWHRLSVDVTKYGGEKYLTFVDSGPSRYAIWRRITNEGEAQLVAQLTSIFTERGPPVEILWDNYSTFKSASVVNLCKRWNVTLVPRAAYRPGGNGIVERNHRTVKTIAARSRCSIGEAVYWYNNSPTTRRAEPPSWGVFSYHPRLKFVKPVPMPVSFVAPYSDGDLVWMKPDAHVRCHQRWLPAIVKQSVSAQKVLLSVGGRESLRHVAHVRPRRNSDEGGPSNRVVHADAVEPVLLREDSSTSDGDSASDVEPSVELPSRPSRQRRRPAWLADYV